MSFLITTAVLVFGGFLTGLYGATVGGGGLLSFPLLVLCGLPTHTAIATNRFAAIILESVSAWRFHREKCLNARLILLALTIGASASFGSVLGSLIVLELNERLVNGLVAALLSSVAVLLILRRDLGMSVKKDAVPNWGILLAASFFLGIYGGFIGTGMGTFMSVLLLGSGFAFLESSAVCRLAGVVWSSSAAVVFAFSGTIEYGYGLALGLGFALGGWVGAGIGIKRGNSFIRLLLLGVAAASVIKLVSRALGY
jgi:uncharacterized membrane protein YfcA